MQALTFLFSGSEGPLQNKHEVFISTETDDDRVMNDEQSVAPAVSFVTCKEDKDLLNFWSSYLLRHCLYFAPLLLKVDNVPLPSFICWRRTDFGKALCSANFSNLLIKDSDPANVGCTSGSLEVV